jgi:uncharacterized protein
VSWEYAPGVEVVKGIRIPMRHIGALAADLYVPADRDAPLPVVVEYQPYRKDEIGRGHRFYSELPRQGYIVARVETPGTGASGGHALDEYTRGEQVDGYDAVEWLAAQSFCDGNVAMMGISYGAFTALQVAALQPPHLRTVIPIHFTDDRYRDDCHYVGGHLRLYYDIGYYGNHMVAFNALPPDPASADYWAALWDEHLAGNEPYLLHWLRHQTDGPYWREGSVGEVAEHIRCPVFMIGGWADGYRNVPLRFYERLAVPRRVLIGPWNHAMPDEAVPGPRIDHLHEVVRWLDHWCHGRDTGILEEPPVVVFEQDYARPDPDRVVRPGRWRAQREWPVPDSEMLTLFLQDDGLLAALAGDDGDDRLEYDATVGTCAGLWSAGLPFGLPGDQRLDEAMSLVYTTEPLDDDVHILGRTSADLHVSTTAAIVGFAVTLADVAPDGSSELVAKGMLNATRRESLTEPRPVVPDEVHVLRIELDATSRRFAAGHRIRVAIANADWPNVWPTPEPASSRVWRGRHRPSRIALPVVPATGDAGAPAFRPAPEAPVPHRQSVDPPGWRTVRDGLSRQAWSSFSLIRRERVDPATVVDRQWEFTAHVDPDEPASASARGVHTSTVQRPSGTVAATSTVSIRGAAARLHVTIDLEVRVDGATHHVRRWSESVPRRLL